MGLKGERGGREGKGKEGQGWKEAKGGEGSKERDGGKWKSGEGREEMKALLLKKGKGGGRG